MAIEREREMLMLHDIARADIIGRRRFGGQNCSAGVRSSENTRENTAAQCTTHDVRGVPTNARFALGSKTRRVLVCIL